VSGIGFPLIFNMHLLKKVALVLIIVILLVLLGVSCQSSKSVVSTESKANVFEILTGTIGYPNNLYFPTRIRVEIKLSAQNRFTLENRVLVNQTIRNPQRFPVNFILRYAAEDILSSDSHSIGVQVFQEGSDIPYLQSKTLDVSLSRKTVPSVIIRLEVVQSPPLI